MGNQRDNGIMILRRKILLGMLIPAVGILLVSFIWPGDGLEILFLVYRVPVAVVNMWEWFEPEVFQYFE
jgi:uncharacterized membrane protein